MIKARRRKLRQRAKALMSAMEENQDEPFVVLPMHQLNSGYNIEANKMYDPDQHPGKEIITHQDNDCPERIFLSIFPSIHIMFEKQLPIF